MDMKKRSINFPNKVNIRGFARLGFADGKNIRNIFKHSYLKKEALIFEIKVP